MAGFRKYGREMVKCSVAVKHPELGTIAAETRNISEAGVFIASEQLLSCLSVGDKLDAKLYSDVENTRQAELSERVTEAQLKVVRLSPDGVGLEFL